MFLMGRPFLILLCLCFLAVRGSHASVSPEDYWKYKLPTTPMPQSLKDSLLPFGGPPANSIANTEQYGGLLSYGKDSLPSSNGNTELSYAKDSAKEVLTATNSYDELLSYAKDWHPGSNGYTGLSYAKDSAKEALTATNSYDELLSYVKDRQPGSDEYTGLSYAKDSAKEALTATNSYDELLSYAKDWHPGSNGYTGLSYAKDSAKEALTATNSYDELLSYVKDRQPGSDEYTGLSYAKDSAKEALTATNSYDELLSYAKDWHPGSNGYTGLSYAKDSPKEASTATNSYNGLLSYARPSRKLLQYDGLLSYGPKASPKLNNHESPTSSTGIMDDAVFFVESDLHHEKKMNLVFKKGTLKSFFLPREISNKIPFSSDKLSEIYDILAMDPESQEAYVLSRRIELCEEPTVEGVEKKCVTSLESMVDFVTSKIGNNVQSLTTNLENDHPKMEYTLKTVRKLSKNDHETVVCHKMGYPYAVFFCHGTATIRSYMVSLIGSDGTKIEAVAACHKETNEFLTNYMVNVLKVVPGSTRVCHFPGAEDNVIWVAK